MRRRLVVLWLLLAGGCDRLEVDLPRSNLAAPFATSGAVVYPDLERGGLWVARPSSGGRLSSAFVDLDGVPLDSVSVADGRLVVLLDDAVAVVDVAAGRVDRRVDTSSRFDALRVSDDARFVVTWARSSSSGDVFATPNRVGIIDLQSVSTAAREVTLVDTRPLDVTFAPPFTLADPTIGLRYAAVHAEGAVSLLRLDDPADPDPQRIVPLVEPGRGAGVIAETIVFSTDDPSTSDDMTMFVLAQGVSDVYAVDLLPGAAGSGRTLQPAINQIATAGSAAMYAYEVAGAERLLVLSMSTATVVDTRSGASSSIALGGTFRRALLWADGGTPKALLYDWSDTGMFLDLDLFESQGLGAARRVSFGGAIESIERVETTGARKAIARYRDGLGLEIVNLDARRVVSLPSNVGGLALAVHDEIVFAVTPFASRLVEVDTVSTAVRETDISAPGEDVFAVGDHVVVTHAEPRGWATSYAAGDVPGGAVGEIFAFTLDGLFDSGGQ